jgi:hypothetical protein
MMVLRIAFRQFVDPPNCSTRTNKITRIAVRYLSGRIIVPESSACFAENTSYDNISNNNNDSINSHNNNGRKVESTRKWLEDIVIGEKLCPFAIPLWKKDDAIRIVTSNAGTVNDAVIDVRNEIYNLFGDGITNTTTNNSTTTCQHETTLVVFNYNNNNNKNNNNSSLSYDEEEEQRQQQQQPKLPSLQQQQQQQQHPFIANYMDFVRLSWTVQEQAVGEQYSNLVQLVLFHPLATHQTYGNEVDNPADYTIRSPYPTIHLLRQEDVLKVVQGGYPDLEYLPSRNKAKLIQQGIQTCQERLQQTYSSSSGCCCCCPKTV